MTRPTRAVLLLTFAIGAAVFAAWPAEGDPATRPPAPGFADHPAEPAALVTIALRGLENVRVRREAGEALTPPFVELYMTWAERVMKAERLAADDRDGEVAAVRTYYERAVDLCEATIGHHVNRGKLLARLTPAYHMEKARLLLSQLGAEVPPGIDLDSDMMRID